MQTLTISPDVTLSFASSDGIFQGVTEVKISGVSMRSPRRPAFVEVRTPDGILMTNYRLESTTQNGDAHSLKFTMDRVDDGWMEYMLHTVRNRYRAGDWTEGPQPALGTTLTLDLRPVTRIFGKTEYRGYAYRYRYESAEHPIYRILDRSTWEPNGAAVGNEFWIRNGTSPSIWPIKDVKEHISTEWYLPGIEQPNIFQYMPFQVQLGGMTATQANTGTLLIWASEVAHIRSLFEKPRGKNEIVHFHEHCGDLANSFSTSWVEVLWAPGEKLTKVDQFNRWEESRAFIWSHLHQQVGFRDETVGAYGVMEEWGLPEFDRYTTHGLPKILDAGVETIMIPSEQENNMNTYGSSNMCCVIDWKIAESVGEDKLTRFCTAAKAGGAWVEMWGNTAMSILQYNLDIIPSFGRKPDPNKYIKFLPREGTIWETIGQAKRPWVRNAAGHIEADHYPSVFGQTNMGDPDIQAHWLRSWKDHHDRIGIEGMFLDSSFNMSADKFSWSQFDKFARAGGATIDQTDLLGQGRPAKEPPAAIRSQYLPYLKTLVAMQQFGYHICVEDIGLFGISRSGPDVETRMEALPLWLDTICVYDAPAIKKAGGNPDDVFFRGLAYRCMWYLYWSPQHDTLTWNQNRGDDPTYAPTGAQLMLFRAYKRARPYFGVRTIHPGEAIIEYVSDKGRLLWTLTTDPIELGESRRVWDLVNDTKSETSTLTPYRFGVYLVEN